MKKVTFNNGFKNHALFGILGLVLNTRFCAHQNLNVKSLKNDLTHKAMAHLNHVSDQAGISSPGLLRCYFLGQMFRLRPFCIHRSFTTKSFSLGQFIWGVEGVLKQHHWTGSLSFDPILHQSIFRLSCQANPLKKSFSKRLFLGAARMSGGHSDANFDDSPKMLDLVSPEADLSEVPEVNLLLKQVLFQKNKMEEALIRTEEAKNFIEPTKEILEEQDAALSRFFEDSKQIRLDIRVINQLLAELGTLEQKYRIDQATIDEFIANTIAGHKVNIRAIVKFLETQMESLEPFQDDDLRKTIKGFTEKLDKDHLVDQSVHKQTFLSILDQIKNFPEEVYNPLACIEKAIRERLMSRVTKELNWGVEGILKQHHWTSSLSLDPILHQSIFRLSIQANSLKKSFSKRLFLGTARMNGGHSDANFDDFPKMVDPVPAAADLSEVPREEKMRALQENLKQTCRVFEECDGFLEKFKEYKMRNDLDSQRVWEAANQEILNKKATENSWAEYDKIARQVLNKDWGFYEEFATLNEEYRDRLRQCMEVLKNLREELEPGQDDDIKKQIETYLERWNLKIEADYSFPLKTLHKLPRALKGFRKEVLEPIGNMYYVAHKRRDQRWDEKFAEATKFSTSFDIKAKRIQEELESTTDFCESEQNEEEQWLGPIGLEALFSGFKNF